MQALRDIFYKYYVSFIALCIFAYAILYNANVSEDAFISFRVVDNFVNGYGLRWNVDERVQAYTNPLWMFLHIPFYALWENIFIITIMLSFFCSMGAVILAMYTTKASPLASVVLLLMPLLFSRGFMAHTTSGLENPLSHLLFACFGWILLRKESRYFWFLLFFCSALAAVNRLDTVILYLPVLLCVLAKRFPHINYRQCIAGLLPLIIWELFSLFYYGFLFPNTKYAKLSANIPPEEYIRHGWSYLLNLGYTDTLGALWILFVAIFLMLYVFSKSVRQVTNIELSAVAIGILAYVIYIICVGGNQVSGRFWSLPIFASAWLMLVIGNSWKHSRLILLLTMSSLITSFFFTSNVIPRYLYPKIVNTPNVYVAGLGLKTAYSFTLARFVPSRMQWVRKCPDCFYRYKNRPYAMLWHERNSLKSPLTEKEVTRLRSIGLYGYQRGSKAIIIDKLALSDALLARMPPKNKKGRMSIVGHIERRIPKGYMYFRITGSLDKMPRNLRAYYVPLHTIISGDLWSMNRLIEIAKFNFGYYDHYKEKYLRRF